MRYHLAGYRLRSIGERSARFKDLLMRFTLTDADGITRLVDTILWLRNGGGKSSLLALFYALLLPRRRDFMARSSNRYLVEYVDSGDTAHVAAAWHPITADTLTGEPDHVLVTGVVYEWPDLRRPHDYLSTQDRLKKTYYAFYAVPGVLDLDCLPVEDAAGASLRATPYLAAVREIAAQYPQTELAVTDTAISWEKILTDRGLDPEMFRQQSKMNHVEGGVEDLFKFTSAQEFIDFLLDLTMPEDQARSVADRLQATADKAAKKPEYEKEAQFCDEAGAGLSAVAEAAGDASAATDLHQEAEREAGTLSAGLHAAVTAHQAAATDFDQAREKAAVDAREADQARRLASDDAAVWRAVAAQHRLAAAEQADADAQQEKDDALRERDAWRAAVDLAERQRLSALLKQTQAEMAEKERDLAPLRDAHDQAAAALRARYTALAGTADADARQQHADAHAADAEARAADADAKAANADAATHTRAAGAAEVRVRNVEQALDKAVADGLLPRRDADPVDARDTAARQVDTLTGDREQVRTRRAARPDERRTVTGQRGAAVEERSHADRDRVQALEAAAALRGRAAALAADPRVQHLVEAGDADDVDMWADAALLTKRLGDEIAHAQTGLVRLAAEAADDRRLLDRVDRTGYLPTTLDADTVIDTLTAAGITADTGWSHLRTVGVTDPAVLTDAAVVRLATGVVVPTDAADAAAAALTRLDLATTAVVAVHTPQAAQAVLAAAAERSSGGDGGTVTWQRLQPGLVDTAHARAVADRAGIRDRDRGEREAVLQDAANADRVLLAAVTGFLTDCPDGHLDALDVQAEALTEQIDGLTARIAGYDDRLARLDADEHADADAEATLTEQIAQTSATVTRLAALADQVADLPAHRKALTDAHEAAAAATATEEAARETAAAARERAADARAAATAKQREADQHRRAAADVVLLGDDPGAEDPDPTVTVDTLQQQYSAARQRYQQQTPPSALSERHTQLAQQINTVDARLAPLPDTVTADAQTKLATPTGQDPTARAAAVADADTRLGRAQERAGRAAGAVEVARGEHTTAHGRVPPTRVPDLDQVTAVDAADADARALERETAATAYSQENTTASNRAADAERKRDAAASDARNLAAVADRLPEATGPAAPFTGGYDDARAAAAQVQKNLDTARQDLNAAQKRLSTRVGNLRGVAARFPQVKITARVRITDDTEEQIAAEAATMAADLALRAATVRALIAEIEQDTGVIVTALGNLVQDALRTLKAAEKHSRLPDGSGTWAGKQFLRIGFSAPATDADLRILMTRVVQEKVTAGLKPEGPALLKAAVKEAAGPGGFRVRILKPSTDLEPVTESITGLGKWSGGEKLTVSTALYCTLAALRADATGTRGTGGGVLLLDNPIGRASHPALVALQRDVAAARGVQLVFTTGVRDPGALIAFPNQVTLDNRPGATRNRSYIVLGEPDDVPEADGEVSAVRVAHPDVPHIPDTDTPDSGATGVASGGAA